MANMEAFIAEHKPYVPAYDHDKIDEDSPHEDDYSDESGPDSTWDVEQGYIVTPHSYPGQV